MAVNENRDDTLEEINIIIDEISTKHNNSLSKIKQMVAMTNEDPFVNYSIASMLKVYLMSFDVHPETDILTVTELLINQLINDQHPCIQIRVLTCFNKILTRNNSSNEQSVDKILQILVKYWQEIESRYFQASKICRNENHVIFEFLRLWKKLVKQILKNKKEDKLSSLREITLNIDKIIITVLETSDSKLTKSALKLLHCVFPYADLTSDWMKIDICFLNNSKMVLTTIQKYGLSAIPLGCDTGFTGSEKLKSKKEDTTQLRLLAIVIIKSVAIACASGKSTEVGNEADSLLIQSLVDLDLYMKSLIEPVEGTDWLPVLFSDQDDMWMEALLALLDLYNLLEKKTTTTGRAMINERLRDLTILNPHRQFLLFMKATDNDDSVLLDLLTGPETCFLQYFSRYLKCLYAEWDRFLQTVNQLTKLESKSSDVEIGMDLSSDNSSGELNSNHDTFEKAKTEASNKVISCGLTLVGLYESESESDSPMNSDDNLDISTSNDEDEYNINDYENLQPVDNRFDNRETNICAKYDCEFYHASTVDRQIEKTISTSRSASDTKTFRDESTCNEYYQEGGNYYEYKRQGCKNNIHVHVQFNEECDNSMSDTSTGKNMTSVFEFSKNEPMTSSKVDATCTAENSIAMCTVVKETSDTFEFSNQVPSNGVSHYATFESCIHKDMLDLVVSCLIRLRMKIEKLWTSRLFPYNPEPLLLNISRIENLYEKY